MTALSTPSIMRENCYTGETPFSNLKIVVMIIFLVRSKSRRPQSTNMCMIIVVKSVNS